MLTKNINGVEISYEPRIRTIKIFSPVPGRLHAVTHNGEFHGTDFYPDNTLENQDIKTIFNMSLTELGKNLDPDWTANTSFDDLYRKELNISNQTM